MNGEGKLLLARSHKWYGKLTLPGGHIELGETMREALRREVKEEVGLDVAVLELLLVQEAIYIREFWKRKHFIFFDFLCKTTNQSVKLDTDELQEYEWVFSRPSVANGPGLVHPKSSTGIPPFQPAGRSLDLAFALSPLAYYFSTGSAFDPSNLPSHLVHLLRGVPHPN